MNSGISNKVSVRYDVDSIADIIEKSLLPLSVVFWLMCGWYVYTLGIPRAQFGVLVVGFSVVFYSLMELSESLRERKYLDIIGLSLAAVYSAFMSTYMYVYFEELFFVRTGWSFWYEYYMAAIMIVVVIYYTYREFGNAFVLVAVGSLLYVLYGAHLRGIVPILAHGGFTFERTVMTGALEYSGVYGSLTQLVSAWIALLLLYAGLLRGYGAFDLVARIAAKTATFVRSGVAQSATIASLIIGMINGAQTANAAMTGSFTIPTMKDSGIKGKTAAGIEAVASSGGQIMPPVMGAAAFVMAALLGMNYTEILIAGLIPAAIFYISVAAAVHYRAVGQLDPSLKNAFDLNKSEFYEADKTRQDMMADSVKYLVPFAILIYTLGIVRWTVSTAGLVTVAAMIVLGIGVPIVQTILSETGETVMETLYNELDNTGSGMKFGFVIFAPIMIIIAVINLIVDLLSATGVPGIISLALLDLSGGVLLIGVILAMTICIILGMGMPTVAAYTLVALLIAPTLTGEFQIPALAAHFFVFYAAMLSGITPPIAISVVVTSGIAESDFLESCMEALRIAAVLFILPFAFIYNPEIILNPFSFEGGVSSFLMLLGALSIIHGINYQIKGMNKALNIGSRAIYFSLGVIALAWPGLTVRIGATVIFAVMFIVQRSIWGIHDPDVVPAATSADD